MMGFYPIVKTLYLQVPMPTSSDSAHSASRTHVISRRLRQLREQASYTQTYIARAIGLSPELVSRIERGKVLPSLETLIRLCAALNCTPNDLLLEENTTQPRIENLVARLRTTPEHIREQILYTVEATLEFERQRRG